MSEKCAICGDDVRRGDDMVYVGGPREHPVCYSCFKSEILTTARGYGAQLAKATFDRDGTPHIRFEPRTIEWL